MNIKMKRNVRLKMIITNENEKGTKDINTESDTDIFRLIAVCSVFFLFAI